MKAHVRSEFFHPAIAEWLGNGGDIVIDGVKFTSLGDSFIDRHGWRVFERHVKLGPAWVKASVSIAPNSPDLRLYLTKGYGNVTTKSPSFLRERTEIMIEGLGLSQVFNLDPSPTTKCVHGQGATSLVLSIDILKKRVIPGNSAGAETSDYIPYDGNSTGAHWPYMHFTAPIKDHDRNYWRNQLYCAARLGGRFVKSDGTPVTEADYPKAVLQNGTHFHRDAPAWIGYTDPRNPWKNKGDMRTADDQHFSVYDAIAEAWLAFPDDECLRWETIFAANRFLFQMPGIDKGTYQWDPGQARARGRILKFAAKCARALLVNGRREQNAELVQLGEDVGKRMLKRMTNQIDHVWKKILDGNTIWPRFEPHDEPKRWDKHSPGEIGIWWWGLYHAKQLQSEFDVEYRVPELNYLMNLIARFCFDAFFVDKNGKAQLPYYVFTDWTHPRDIKPSGEHLAWLAAMHAVPNSQEEEDKFRAIEALSIDDRFKGPLALDPFYADAIGIQVA